MQSNTCSKAPISDSQLIGVSHPQMHTAAIHMTNQNAPFNDMRPDHRFYRINNAGLGTEANRQPFPTPPWLRSSVGSFALLQGPSWNCIVPSAPYFPTSLTPDNLLIVEIFWIVKIPLVQEFVNDLTRLAGQFSSQIWEILKLSDSRQKVHVVPSSIVLYSYVRSYC